MFLKFFTAFRFLGGIVNNGTHFLILLKGRSRITLEERMKYYCNVIYVFFLLFFCSCSKQNEKIIPSFNIIENSSLLSKDFGVENIANIENLECCDSVLVVTDY